MPFYDYRCTYCDHEQEELHKMSESPDVVCSECGSPMTKTFKIGHGGYKMVKDGTRRRDYKTRFGGKTKKSDNALTPSESATLKAQAQMEARKASKKNPSDPYAQFND